jgi:hypothetical protein
MPPTSLATAADYADGLLTARRFKTTLIFVILACLLIELAIFFTARYGVLPTPSTATTQPAARQVTSAMLEYLTVLATFVGLVANIVLAFVLLLIATIMLVGRLIGVGSITSAFLRCVVLGVLLFPWQALLANPTLTPDGARTTSDFRIPGVLYTWGEVAHPTLGAHFANQPWHVAYLRWARYVAFPLLAIIILLTIQRTSARALREAMGENIPEPADATPAA